MAVASGGERERGKDKRAVELQPVQTDTRWIEIIKDVYMVIKYTNAHHVYDQADTRWVRGEREGGLMPRRGIRAVELQPVCKPIQVGSKLQRTFRWSQNIRMRITFTNRLILG